MKETEQQAEPKTAKRRGRAQQDLTGQKFGRLTVLAMIPGHDGIPAKVQCRCECGNIITAATGNVKRGNTRSCGCMPYARKTKYARTDEATVVRANKKGRQGPKPRNLDGQKFGRLTVLRFAGYDKNDHAVYECQCECGRKKLIRGDSLITGGTKSCGCQRVIAGKDNVTHGDSRKDSPYAPIYHTWALMRDRCHNPNNDYYKDYGGRGIQVCDEWNQYGTFKEWSLQHGWKPGLSIDRVDVDGDYTPENCRWVNSRIQAYNKRKSARVDWNGVNMSVYDWSKMLSLPFEHSKNLLAAGGEPHLVRDYLMDEMAIGSIAKTLTRTGRTGSESRYDLSVGCKFGYLTVISDQFKEKGNSVVECRCICGKTKKVQVSSLRAGRVKSCGCMRSQVRAQKSKIRWRNKRVVDFFRLYLLWLERKNASPCELCEEWRTWSVFRSWAAEKDFEGGCLMLRPDESRPYCPDNCILYPTDAVKHC